MLLKIYNEAGIPRNILAPLAEALTAGELIIIPTDTRYNICCDALNAKSVERLAMIKGIDPAKSQFSIMCQDIAEMSDYAKVSNSAFKLIKANTPGPFSFILPTSSALPKIYKGRKEVGMRIPRHHLVQELIAFFGQPITGFSLPDQGVLEDDAYLYHPELIYEKWGNQVAYVVDGGVSSLDESAVIDCTEEPFQIIREGKEEIRL